MDHTFTKPGKETSFIVRRYLTITPSNNNDILCEKFVPDGSTSLVFNFSGTVTVIDKGEKITVPPFFITSPIKRTLIIEANPAPQTIVAICKASVFSRYFRIKNNRYTESPFFSAHNIIPVTLYESMSKCDSPEDRIKLFEEFIQQKNSVGYQPDEIDKVYDQIMELTDFTRLNTLMANLELNPRSFRRKFLERVGVNAKMLSRLVRINYLWNCFLTDNETDFQNMVFDGKYFDQPHLINDFKKIIGESPKSFFKRNQSDMQIISGKNI